MKPREYTVYGGEYAGIVCVLCDGPVPKVNERIVCREVLPDDKSYTDGIAEGRRLERDRILAMLIETFPKDHDGPYRCGAWFAEWIENEGAK